MIEQIWADASLLGKWDARAQTPADVASETAALIAAIDEALDTAGWVTHDSRLFPADTEAQADLVRSFVSRDAHGDAHPASGYSFSLIGAGVSIQATVRVRAGSQHVGRRVPSNAVSVLLKGSVGSANRVVAARVFDRFVDVWAPTSAAARDQAIATASSGRGARAPVVGYRTWVSNRLGAVTSAAEGLTVASSAAGCLISAPDDWPPRDIAAAMVATLEASDIVTLPGRT